jgi:hypothetical protein
MNHLRVYSSVFSSFASSGCCITKLVGLEEHMSRRPPGGAEDRSDSQF